MRASSARSAGSASGSLGVDVERAAVAQRSPASPGSRRATTSSSARTTTHVRRQPAVGLRERAQRAVVRRRLGDRPGRRRPSASAASSATRLHALRGRRVAAVAVEPRQRGVHQIRAASVARSRPRRRGRTALRRSGDRRGRGAHAVAAAALRLVLGAVGGAQQRGRPPVAARGQRDAPRERDAGAAARSARQARGASASASAALAPGRSTQNSSPPSRPAVTSASPAGGGAQRVGGGAQHRVAGLVAARVVDRLEPVEVAEQQRGRLAARGELLEPLLDRAPVGEAGQRVLERERRERENSSARPSARPIWPQIACM